MTIFLVSDTHFGHSNIIQYQSRPFKSPEEMDEAMIENWNKVVKPSDHIYHLGDLTMARGNHFFPQDKIMSRLQGHKRFIFGNHDQLYSKYYFKWFEKVMSYRVLDNIIMSHIPIHPESMGKFKANIHGHTHGKSYKPPYINVSVEVIDYTPVAFEEIKARI